MNKTMQTRLDRVAERLAGKHRRLQPDEMDRLDMARRVWFVLYTADKGYRPDLIPAARKIAALLTAGKGEVSHALDS